MIERRKSKLWAVEALFDQLGDGVCIADASGDLLYVNPAARRLLELPDDTRTLENLCGLLCERLDGPGLPKAARECPLRRPEIDEAEKSVTFVGRHGPRPGYRWNRDAIKRSERFGDLRVRCLKSSLPLAGVEEKLHIVLVEDASAELELQRHKEDWRAMIAHDLRAPLTSVYAGLRLLEDAHPGKRGDPDSELVQLGLRSCRSMMELLDLYLDVAQFDSGGAAARLEPVSVFDAVDEAVAEQSALAASRATVVELDVAPGIKALADRRLLKRVVENLLNNAIKYGDPGARVLIRAVETEDRVRVSVKDEGPGIEEKVLPFLFDRYYQAQARREGRIKGNGLGLTFCREAARLMNAELTVESSPGKGAEFSLSLPKAP